MASLQFNIGIQVKNAEILPELQARIGDLTPCFVEIVEEWARGNEDKFDAAQGKEAMGASVAPDVFWEALTPGYREAKRKAGFADQIMVRTGELRASLIDPSGFFHEETPQHAVFGTPKSEEDEMKVAYNYEKRPVIFLGLSDQNMIKKTVVDYFSFGENFKQILFARGLQNIGLSNEVAQMDMEFQEATAQE